MKWVEFERAVETLLQSGKGDVAARAMLRLVKTGDKARFTAEKADGQYAVTALEPAE